MAAPLVLRIAEAAREALKGGGQEHAVALAAADLSRLGCGAGSAVILQFSVLPPLQADATEAACPLAKPKRSAGAGPPRLLCARAWTSMRLSPGSVRLLLRGDCNVEPGQTVGPWVAVHPLPQPPRPARTLLVTPLRIADGERERVEGEGLGPVGSKAWAGEAALLSAMLRGALVLPGQLVFARVSGRPTAYRVTQVDEQRAQVSTASGDPVTPTRVAQPPPAAAAATAATAVALSPQGQPFNFRAFALGNPPQLSASPSKPASRGDSLKASPTQRKLQVQHGSPTPPPPSPPPLPADLRVFVATEETQVQVRIADETAENAAGASGEGSAQPSEARIEDVGGLDAEAAAIREVLQLALGKPEALRELGLRPPKGVLLHGPPGTGKTMLARSLATESGATVLAVNAGDVASRFVGESEARLRTVFERARQRAPCVVLIDEVDALCPRRDEAIDEAQRRLVGALLVLMDGVEETDRVVVLAVTNRPNALDPALRRPGRLDREVELGVPSERARYDILLRMLRRMPHALSEAEIAHLASVTHGFVGADLQALCREAALHAVRRAEAPGVGPDRAAEAKEAQLASDVISVRAEDVRFALTAVSPSAMRELLVEVPRVRWSDIGGQREVKQRLREAVDWPLEHADAFARLGIAPPKGILLYGPPGCSKTLMAKALATESSRNFISVKGPQLFSKWVGESEKAVQSLFRKARAAAPSIVFFDEVDSIAAQRNAAGEEDGGGSRVADRVLGQLLVELDGVEPLSNVVVIAATNRPDMVDRALLRPGRIDRVLYVGPPDAEAAREIFEIELRCMAHAPDVNVARLAELCAGFSGAEISAVCREAAVLAMEEDANVVAVRMRHLEAAARAFVPRISPQMLDFYRDYQAKCGLVAL